MALKTLSSLLPLLFVFLVTFAIEGEAAAGGWTVPEEPAKKDDVKHPEWLIHHDGSFLIPGIGRVLVPPAFGFSPYSPSIGSSGSGGSTGSGGGANHNHVPGGDDTFVPNPGVEVPNPGSGGGAPGPARP
ncbi:hypothetical protein FNV43_RR13560 [Rhamnella rubrinervis]|uniref:Cell wall protein n=1 Tax=Rhamnella rubrinervis TaxID=2594499 RepID=A0A8K0MFD2_9ROSA|nr:hypothetical protein FNV43_RR13560 [Rhamnella rubrinervis]